MSQTCAQIFCGCEYYNKQSQVTTKVYICIGLMLVILSLSVRIGSEWFIFKDYYPMKERSPVLCIMMIACISIQLIIYPLAFTYNYFTRNWGDFKYSYRAIFYAFDGSLYILYLMRGLRLVYAHQTDISRSKTWIFKFMKNQYFLVTFFVVITCLKVIPILVMNADKQQDWFLTFIDVNLYSYAGVNMELGFGIKQTIHEFIWLSAIVYCLWLQTLVHEKYSMKNELLMVLLIGFVFNISSIAVYSTQIGKPSIIRAICLQLPDYPILQMMRDLNVFGYFLVSIIIPLYKKRVYHMLLPIGRHHDIVKTMRDFLMESEFISIFEAFLKSKDMDENTVKYTETLQYWKKLMVVKYKVANQIQSNHHHPQECIDEIKNLIKNIEDKPIKEIHTSLISHLKQSILSLEECEDGEETEERDRYMVDITQKIDELELIFLEKLDHIYKTDFIQTKSYYFLKMYLIRNKKINISMITMGMAVMVESQDAL